MVSVRVTLVPCTLSTRHSSKGAGKGFPLITTFDSDTNTIFITLIVLENNVQSSTRSFSCHDAPLIACSVALPRLCVGVNRVMHRADHQHHQSAVLLLFWAWRSLLIEVVTCLLRYQLNFVLANQRVYRSNLYLHQWKSCWWCVVSLRQGTSISERELGKTNTTHFYQKICTLISFPIPKP